MEGVEAALPGHTRETLTLAIRDLLWACPICHEPAGIRPEGRRERCQRCRAEFRRGRGAHIVVRHDGGEPASLHAREWLARLAPPSPLDNGLPGHRLEPVLVRRARDPRPVLGRGGELLGWSERFGHAERGRIALDPDIITFEPKSGSPEHWRLLDVTALQPSSTALQIKLKDRPVISIRFVEGSVRAWERRIQDALRAVYARHGLGEILDFQPRITTR